MDLPIFETLVRLEGSFFYDDRELDLMISSIIDIKNWELKASSLER